MASRRMRSRGCEQCKKRRVKCDETADFCRQCLRFGLYCSGPVRGMTIVDMTAEAAFSRDRAGTQLDQRPRKVRKTSQPLSTPSSSWQSDFSDSSGPPSRNSVSASPSEDQPAISIIQWTRPQDDPRRTATHQATLSYQPSTTGVFELFLIKQFLDFSRLNPGPASPASWLTKLPEWISSSQLPAFRCSIRASTTALHAVLHRDIAAQKEAYRWYVASLNRFRKHLETQTEKGLVEGNPEFVPGHEEILIPVFLGLFEAFTNATPAAIVQHLAAASKIVALRGPDNCKNGFYYQMFLITRLTNVFISIALGHPPLFTSPEWRTIPFEEGGKPLLHELVDIMLSIQLCLETAGHNTLINLTVLKISKSNDIYVGMKEKCYQLLDNLQDWWKRLESSPRAEASTSLFSMTEPMPQKPQEPPVSGQHSPMLFVHRDTLTSFSVSLYNASCLILHTLIQALIISAERTTPQFYPLDDPNYHLKEVIFHASSILNIAAYHQGKAPNGMDAMHNSFGLKILELLGPPDYSMQAKILAANSSLKRPEKASQEATGPPA